MARFRSLSASLAASLLRLAVLLRVAVLVSEVNKRTKSSQQERQKGTAVQQRETRMARFRSLSASLAASLLRLAVLLRVAVLVSEVNKRTKPSQQERQKGTAVQQRETRMARFRSLSASLAASLLRLAVL